LWQKSQSHEQLLHLLRQHGISKLDSIKVVREICAVSLGEAKKIVTYSAEWRDTLESTATLHDELASVLDLGAEKRTTG
jgi:ribosomal protein L7/L12